MSGAFGQAVARSQPRVNLIVAWDRARVIGRGGTLPWHLPQDLRHFRRVTMGHPIVMGRRTWESIGRALPGRRSIVVTANPNWSAPGCERVMSLAQALALCQGEPEVFVIGGARLFAEALPRAQRLFVTEIDADFGGDTYFPPIDLAAWRETARERLPPAPDRPFEIDFVTLEPATTESGP